MKLKKFARFWVEGYLHILNWEKAMYIYILLFWLPSQSQPRLHGAGAGPPDHGAVPEAGDGGGSIGLQQQRQ